MKKIACLAVFMAIINACNSQVAKLPLNIKGTINNDVSGKVYLERMNDRNIPAKVDSVSINAKTFEFKTSIPEAGIYQINIANEQIIGLILDGGETITIKADGSSTPDKAATAAIDGSINMVLFNEVMTEMQKFNKVRTDLEPKFQAAKSEAERNVIRTQFADASKMNQAAIMPKIQQLGTSLAGILATNNFLQGEENAYYLSQLKDKLEAEGKNHFFAKMFIQMVNGKNAGTVGTSAPDFELTTLQGKKFKLSELKGKTVILDFWATWCGPCIMSFPGMQKAAEKYKDDPNIVFGFVNTFERVGADGWKDHVGKFITNRGFTFMDPILDVSNTAAQAYGVEGIPAKFCIDKNGKVKHKGSGYLGSTDAVYNEMVEWVEK